MKNYVLVNLKKKKTLLLEGVSYDKRKEVRSVGSLNSVQLEACRLHVPTYTTHGLGCFFPL